jgi:hypothetical protein
VSSCSVAWPASPAHAGDMEGFVIETTLKNEDTPHGREFLRWIGVARDARELLTQIEGRDPRIVESGPDVLSRARALDLQDGEARPLDD